MRISYFSLLALATCGVGLLMVIYFITVFSSSTGTLRVQPQVGRKQQVPPTASSSPSAEISTTWEEFYDYLQEIKPCKKMKILGGPNGGARHDGSKIVCFDNGLAPQPGSCTILSFGIGNNWGFDDAMERYGCKVYAFDPSMNTKDHVRHHSIYFYQLGISDRRKTVEFKNQLRQVDSYRAILEKINETNSIIDYLKMDTEGAEIQFFENVLYEDPKLLNNVKQIGMEIHPNEDTRRRDKLWKCMHKLQTIDFHLVTAEPNPTTAFTYKNRRVSAGFEVVWINDKFKL